MCAIVDANVVKGLLTDVSTAGGFLLSQVERGKTKIAVGGTRLKCEYQRAGCGRWLVEAIRAGIVKLEEDQKIDDLAGKLAHQRQAATMRIQSDDLHILALAQISGARLLYSADRDLHADFTNKALIDRPRGKVYSTSVEEPLADKHRSLLRQRLCRL